MKWTLSMLIAVVAVVHAYAQEPVCNPDETTKDCFVRFGAEWARATDATSVVQTEVATANTGLPDLGSPGQSAAKDFLNTLVAALLMPINGNDSQPLALEYNRPIRLFGEQRLKLQAVLARPELSTEVKTRLSGNASALTAVDDSLSEFDDVTVSGALEPSTFRLGRSLTPHRESYERMLDARFRAVDTSEMRQERMAAAADALIDNFAGKFALLLSNQPQFHGSVIFRTRKNVVGPNEQSARVTYEMGFGNLNHFYRKNASCRDLSDANAMDCALSLETFARTAAAVESADRIALSVEYRASDGFDVTLPEYAVDFRASRAHSFVYSLAYGRTNMLVKDGRLDLAVNYEDTTVSEITDAVPTETVTESPKAVRDRFVASATFTYKINDTMAVPLSLIYANHTAYLGDVDRRLNAHIGVTFKMR